MCSMGTMKQSRCCVVALITFQAYMLFCFWLKSPCPVVKESVCDTVTHPIPPVQSTAQSCPITWVTSYYRIPGKHSHGDYVQWIRNMKEINMCLVMYTDVFDVSFGHPSTTLIVPTSLCAVSSYHLNMTSSEWNRELSIDPECRHHNHYQLYWVWAMKPFFLNATAARNPFRSEAFFWIDAGYFRDERHNGMDITTVRTHSIKPGAMTFILVYPLWLWRLNECISSPVFLDAIAGNLFGGDALAVHSWCRHYEQMLLLYHANSWFLGKDQTVMNSICLQTPDLCHYIKHNRTLHESAWGALFETVVSNHSI